MQRVYLGLGANLNTPKKQLDDAVVALKNLPNSEFIMRASLWGHKINPIM